MTEPKVEEPKDTSVEDESILAITVMMARLLKDLRENQSDLRKVALEAFQEYCDGVAAGSSSQRGWAEVAPWVLLAFDRFLRMGHHGDGVRHMRDLIETTNLKIPQTKAELGFAQSRVSAAMTLLGKMEGQSEKLSALFKAKIQPYEAEVKMLSDSVRKDDNFVKLAQAFCDAMSR